MVIIVVRKVESAVVVVVIHVFIDHNYRIPGVEERVGDDGSKGRTADYEATVDVAAIDAVVEVVGSAVIIDRSDVVRNVNVSVVVVVIRVYVGGVRPVSGVRSMAVGMTSGSGLTAVAHIAVSFCAGTVYRLRLCLALCRVAAFGCGIGRNRIVRICAGFCNGIGCHVINILPSLCCGIYVLFGRCRCRRAGCRWTSCRSGRLVGRCGAHSTAGC